MKDLEIVIEDNIFITTNKSIVDTRFFISYNNNYFPNNEWTDFTFPILEEWKYNLLKVRESQNVSFSLYFHDGPFWLEVHKNDKMELKIDCINDRNIKKSEMTIYCSYYDLLGSIYRTMKIFVKILYKNGMNKGDFSSVYNQSIISLNEISDIIKISNK